MPIYDENKKTYVLQEYIIKQVRKQITNICYYNTNHGTVGGYWDVLKWDFYEMMDKIIVEDEINPFF